MPQKPFFKKLYNEVRRRDGGVHMLENRCINNDHLIYNSFLFSQENMDRLKDLMIDEELAKDSYLFNEGDKSDSLYFIKDGAVKLTRVTDDGKDLTLYYYQTGDIFGDFGDTPTLYQTYSAIATCDCKIGVLNRRDLEIAIWQNSDLGIDFINWVSHMNRFTQLKLRDLMFFGKLGALASTLIRIANTFGQEKENAIYIYEKFTNHELASMIGATRETVNRMLSQLKKDDIIHYENGKLVILDIGYLRQICHCEGCPRHICRL